MNVANDADQDDHEGQLDVERLASRKAAPLQEQQPDAGKDEERQADVPIGSSQRKPSSTGRSAGAALSIRPAITMPKMKPKGPSRGREMQNEKD